MIVYTFKSFPFVEELQKQSDNLFVFSSLRSDMTAMERRLMLEQPDYVLGIAKTRGYSRLEPIAVNKFNHGQVLKGGESQMSLHMPGDGTFPRSHRPSYTFCNWTMYRIQWFLGKNDYKTKLMFIHLNPKDLDRLQAFLSRKDFS